MASELQETLARIVNKSNILIEKYRLLASEKEELEVQLEVLQESFDAMRKENETLKQQNEYLTLARNIAPNPDEATHARSIITSLVRDIDKCISQLNE